MAYVATVLSGAVGEKSNNKPAPNKPEDVKKVQRLLGKCYGLLGPVFKDGVCDAPMKARIAEFQQLWGGAPDSTIDPIGQTLKRLDRLANPLILNPITQERVVNGGYKISYKTCNEGPLPGPGKGYTLHLCFSDERNSIDVSNRPASDLLNADNLVEVLKIFEKLGCWATPVACRLQLKWKGTTVSTSDPQMLEAPVQPHNGKMLPLDEVNNGAKLTYQGNPDAKQFWGRMFAEVPGYDKLVFIYAGKFETKNEFRGFDCITYAGTTCAGSTMHMGTSEDMATHLGATSIDYTRKIKDPKSGKEVATTVKLDSAEPAVVKEFFAGPSTGYYLMWSGGHVVIVADGFVHEFKYSAPSGYTCTPVLVWLAPYEKSKLTVRKLPGKPARAV
ncbi:MAG TPA: peptidoglycan-binding domain-containing protein [Bryobacteraceae bacterium]|nr:peptidoglycan-binding domain-containing protein [Bryobacteraceae bacterium]